MDRYQRVEKPRPETAINENEIRITTQGLIRNYVSYASSLLQEKRVREIVLKAMGQAISKAVAVAEIIKKKIPGLHQDTAISSVSVTDVWEPIEEGLVPLETTRHVSMMSISLSTRELNKNSPGYQAPLLSEQLKQQQKFQQPQLYQQQQRQPRQAQGQLNEGRGRGRGWGRGGYGGYGGYGNNQGGYGNNQGGYGGYGNSQGGYGGYGNNQGGYGGYGNNQENGGWNWNWGRGGGRGRGGWGYHGAGYERGRGGGGAGGRGYGRGRGRMGGRGRGNQA
ncbi:uncharacterized protein [Elaeis guineensis]|uniref:RNA-binding protein FUS isoform X3 n=1 Tax=Elaeis guineensis var. tenera TaxID=51953 RepID=A0A6J0PN35_ELAGV|nr:RNA-binding protein FUS isoform X3 [Elaeis guineensis]